jgi:phosphate transport system substrate-binding protein
MLKAVSFLLVGLLSVLPVSACSSIAAPASGVTTQSEITISGAFALYPLVTRWVEEYQRLNPNIRFDIASGGAGKGMSDVLAGKVDIGMISREITPEEETRGAYAIPVAKDAVFALVNTQNPVANDLLARGLSRETLIKIFISGEITTWGQAVGRPEVTEDIHIYTRSDICGAAATWSLYLGGAQSDLLGKGKFGDPGMVQAVKNDPLGIGYNNLIYAYGLGDVAPKGTFVLPIDLNHNNQADPDEILDTRQKADAAIISGLYPVPPSRALYLVTKGRPQGVVQAFLAWALTDGQAYVESSGYIRLANSQLQEALTKVR